MGDRIRAIRGDLSQEKFGEQVGITKQAVSQFELGKKKPSRETVRAIAKRFNVSYESIVEGEAVLSDVMARIEDLTPEQFRTLMAVLDSFNIRKTG